MMKHRIIRDYLESLKEDSELDYIFPILLEAMGFHIVATPKNSKGQSQYGKDVIAMGKDEEGKLFRWYFQLKGYAAKDINDKNFNADDGVRVSICAAKDVPYEDSSIPSFNNLPVKIVLVHNGILHENTRPQYEGFLKREFPQGGFERWDIDILTGLFSKYLFDENLFCDYESYTLFKKILVLLDTPGWNTSDVDTLIEKQLNLCPTDFKDKRKTKKCFASLNLFLAIVYKYSQDAKNLLPAKMTSDRIVLKTWGWILRNKAENIKIIIASFSPIVNLHLNIYSRYLNKIIPLAINYKGLYVRSGGDAELICYPLRCYDFMNTLLYHAIVSHALMPRQERNEYRKKLLNIVLTILGKNSGFDLPLLDTHAITIQLLFSFVLGSSHDEENETVLFRFIERLLSNVIIQKRNKDMFPDLYGNRKEVARSLYGKSSEYQDKSSLLLMTLVEIIAWMDAEDLYNALRKTITETHVNLQISYPIEDADLEVHFFEHQLYRELAVETSIHLPETLQDFKTQFKMRYDTIEIRTMHTKFWFLTILAHVHYQTDWFPDFLNLGFLEPLKRHNT